MVCMVSTDEEIHIDDLERLQPIPVKAVPPCFQNRNSFKPSRFDCIICDFFESCWKVSK